LKVRDGGRVARRRVVVARAVHETGRRVVVRARFAPRAEAAGYGRRDR